MLKLDTDEGKNNQSGKGMYLVLEKSEIILFLREKILVQ